MKKILITYDYFTPAFRAGGPTRSLHNLVSFLGKDLDIYVLTTDRDHDGTPLDVVKDEWVDFNGDAKVYYASTANQGLKARSVIAALRPDLIHINGMFSPFATIAPLAFAKANGTKLAISPRGMLQRHSLRIKSFKKQAYLKVVWLLYLNKLSVHWHFTTLQEQSEFQERFDFKGETMLIGNVPAFYMLDHAIKPIEKHNPVKLMTVALVSPMKNHLKVLEALRQVTNLEVQYDIYGPVIDKAYWQKCEQVIETLPDNIKVNLKGEVNPNNLHQIYADYHFYIQPSQSENFGHSLFEALACGLPVITSDQTPWRKLEQKQAGWDVDLTQNGGLEAALHKAVMMDDPTYQEWRKGARKVAQEYVNGADFKRKYLEMYDKEG